MDGNHQQWCLLPVGRQATLSAHHEGNIASIYEDSSKELWIGSWEEGLYRIRTNGTIDNFRHDPKNPNSICSDFVRSCCEDNLGNLWIGTFHGLNRYDKSTGQFQLYTANDNKPDGLTHSSIWCIVKDEQGTYGWELTLAASTTSTPSTRYTAAICIRPSKRRG